MRIARIGKSAQRATSFRILRVLQVNGSRCLRRSWFATPAIRSAKRSYGGIQSLLTKIRLGFSFAVSFRATAYEHERSDLNEPHARFHRGVLPAPVAPGGSQFSHRVLAPKVNSAIRDAERNEAVP